MNKYLNYLFCAAAIVLLAVCCNSHEVETVVEQTVRTTVPYSMSVTASSTKVSYENDRFAFKSGDKLCITSETRTDITGTLQYVGENRFAGSLSYEGEEPVGVTLSVKLIHADNTDASTYAAGIAPALQEAVEHYSLFTATCTYGETSVSLTQSAAFLHATVRFNRGDMAGETPVEIKVDGNTIASGRASVTPESGGLNSVAEFVAIVPGNTVLTAGESQIVICERDVDIIPSTKTNKTLVGNTYYTITRELTFVPINGDPFWSDGSFGRYTHASASVIGIIVYVNDGTEEGSEITEGRSALVMALENTPAEGGVQWGADNKGPFTARVTTPSQTHDAAHFSGLNNTTTVITNYGDGIENTAVYRAVHYEDIVNAPSNTTGWFLPSIGQWLYSISQDGFGGANHVSEWTNNNSMNWLSKGSLKDLVRVMPASSATDNALVVSLNERLADLATEYGCTYRSFAVNDNFWTSSEGNKDSNNKECALRMNFGSVEGSSPNWFSTIKANPVAKSTKYPYQTYPLMVRAFLAF